MDISNKNNININGAKITVIGLGESGEAAALLGAHLGANIFMSDGGSTPDILDRQKRLISQGITVEIGGHTDKIYDADLWVLSPGIPQDAAMVLTAKEKGIPVPVTPEKPYSIDANLFHISYEGGILEDPWQEPPEDMFMWTTSPEKAPNTPEYVEIDFEKGEPVAVNGEPFSPAALLKRLNELGAKHGIGRVDMVENRFVGIKSRGVYETPGGTILHIAHRALEQITLDREVMRLKDSLMPKIAELIYYGFWFAPEFQALKKMIEETQERVSGTVRLKLYKGQVYVAGRKSPNSLYKGSLASFDEEGGYSQADATGFIRLQGLRLKVLKN